MNSSLKTDGVIETVSPTEAGDLVLTQLSQIIQLPFIDFIRGSYHVHHHGDLHAQLEKHTGETVLRVLHPAVQSLVHCREQKTGILVGVQLGDVEIDGPANKFAAGTAIRKRYRRIAAFQQFIVQKNSNSDRLFFIRFSSSFLEYTFQHTEKGPDSGNIPNPSP